MISVMMATRFGSDKKLQFYLTTITEVLNQGKWKNFSENSFCYGFSFLLQP